MSKGPDKQDWFAAGLKERLPKEMRDAFTPEQVQALKIAFGARRWGRHPIDLRGTVNLWRSRYYFVFLLGRNHRDLSRTEESLSRAGKTLIFFSFLVFSMLVGLVALYILKSALGINLFPSFSLGLWDWMKGS